MNAAIRDQIAGLRAEVKHHKRQATSLREMARQARGRRDPLAALRYSTAAGERAFYARQTERRITELRAQLGVTRSSHTAHNVRPAVVASEPQS